MRGRYPNQCLMLSWIGKVFDAIVDRKNTDVLITKVSKKFFDKMMDHTTFMIFWNMMSYDAKRKEVRIDIERPKIKLKK